MDNKLVGVLVAVFALIFVAAYVLVFGNNPTSTNPEDWAHFATYLSGTVGVTAVLGTLYAVVRTLGQQQALIDSQNDMLEKQERQLKLAQKQLDGEERRRQVELAYNSSLKIFPILMDNLKKNLSQEYSAFNRSEQEIIEKIRESGKRGSYRNYEFVRDIEDVYLVLLDVDDHSVYRFSERLFLKIDKIYLFMLDKVEIEEDLKEYFEIYLHEEYDYFSQYLHFFYCYHAYLIGCGQKDYAAYGVDLLNFPKGYHGRNKAYECWMQIGEKARKYIEAIDNR
tara:strand:- start:221 stop:1063 length:843 start_codon:yes stop_codon:yes gene_type:complete